MTSPTDSTFIDLDLTSVIGVVSAVIQKTLLLILE